MFVRENGIERKPSDPLLIRNYIIERRRKREGGEGEGECMSVCMCVCVCV